MGLNDDNDLLVTCGSDFSGIMDKEESIYISSPPEQVNLSIVQVNYIVNIFVMEREKLVFSLN